MRSGVLRWGLVGLLLAASACEYVDRWRGPAETGAPGGGLALSMEAPGVIRLGEEGMVRLSVTNRGDTAVHGVHAQLLIPEWMEPVMPDPTGREVTMVSTPEEGTRLSYRMDDPPLQPGETQSVQQRIRAPLIGGAEGAVPWSRVVRARLVAPDGQPLGAEVESEIAIDTTGWGDRDTLPGDTLREGAEERGALIHRDRVGPIRPGMTVGAVRQAAPNARDTTWTQEGTRERGLVVPLEQGGERAQVTALLEGDVVSRIHVRDRALRTREGLGVGSRLEELRAAYGRTCADVGEGRVVVWFAQAPEISFALDAPAQNPAQIREQPERIPGSAQVRELWVRRVAARCP